MVGHAACNRVNGWPVACGFILSHAAPAGRPGWERIVMPKYLWEEKAIISALNAVLGLPYTKDEVQEASFIARQIFGSRTDQSDEMVESRVIQGLAIVRIRNTWIGWINNRNSITEVLSICEGYAAIILGEHGVEYPFVLPEKHHPLAGDAIRLIRVTKEVMGFTSYTQRVAPHILIRAGAKLSRAIQFMETRWYRNIYNAGCAKQDQARKGFEKVHGSPLAIRQRHQRIRSQWRKRRKEHPNLKKGAIDEVVAKELGESARTIRRVRTAKNS